MDQVTSTIIGKSILMNDLELLPWSPWIELPSPESARSIEGPIGPGVYQIRRSDSKEKVQFGESKNCTARLKSIFPAPFGVGTRNNFEKRNYIQSNWSVLEYRYLSVESKAAAKFLENFIKSKQDHLFNT